MLSCCERSGACADAAMGAYEGTMRESIKKHGQWCIDRNQNGISEISTTRVPILEVEHWDCLNVVVDTLRSNVYGRMRITE